VLVSGAWPASAQTKTLVWDNYDVTLTIEPDGDLRVVERQVIRFLSGTFTQGWAVIPLDKTEGIDAVTVADGDGVQYQEVGFSADPHTFSTHRGDEGLEIEWSFPPVSEDVRTFTLAYTVHGGLRVADEGDTLQWIAIDNERDFPIQAASVTVRLPEGASFLAIDSAGVETVWNQVSGGRAVVFEAAQPLSAYDTLEVGIKFTHGVIPDRAPAWQSAQDLKDTYELTVRPLATLGFGALAALLGLGGPLLVYLLWYTRGRDPRVSAVPEYITEPPGPVPAGVLGTLVDEKADMPDITATIVDLARRGHLSMEEVETTLWGTIRSKDFVFRRQDNPKDPLRPFEQDVLAGIFPGQAREQKLSALTNKFYIRLPAIQKKLYQELVNFRYFMVSPDAVRSRWKALGIGLLVASFLGMSVLSAFLVPLASTAPCLFGGLAVTGLALLVGGQYMPVKTVAGAEAAARWLAFRTYLTRIEQLTDLSKAAELFDRYLPYAVAFGLSQSWVRKFSGLANVPSPVWYGPYRGPGMRPVGAGPAAAGGGPLASPPAAGAGGGLQGLSEGMAGGLQSMSSGLTQMLNSAGRVLASAPASSGSGGGGFRGGGFSRGGGGGGGGRGFR
jgi:uncharacterized membrane protein YgcG